MRRGFALTDNIAVGTIHCVGFHGEWDEPDFSDTDKQRGKEFRKTRVAADKSLGEAASIFGLSVTRVSDIERGRARLEPHDEALRLLTEAKR